MEHIGSKVKFSTAIQSLLSEKGIKAKKKSLFQFLDCVDETCPWFSDIDEITEDVWARVGGELNEKLRSHNSDSIPAITFSFWSLINECLQKRDVQGLNTSKRPKKP